MEMRCHNSRGAGLLELLLALAIFMAVLPFVYDFAIDQRDRVENARIVRQIGIVRDALEQYVEENKQKLLAPVSANVTRVRLSDLKRVNADSLKDVRLQLRIVKSRDMGGRSFIQGVAVFDFSDLTPLRIRQIAALGGNAGGFADGQMLYGSFGTWQVPISQIEATVGSNSILARTKPFRSGGDYLRRLPSDNPLDATMQSDMSLGGHNITDTRNLTATSARFLDVVETDSIETSGMSVTNRLDWTAGLEVFGDALVMGSIMSENRSLDAAHVSVSGRSLFRNVTTETLRANNLHLSGFTVARSENAPSTMSISGSLDMTLGHIRAIETQIGFSGSVAPRLQVTNRIEDSANPSFYWDVSGGRAELGDLYLTNLSQIMRSAFTRERTGKTETERLMSNVAHNINATVSDYMRALENVRRTVEAKYAELQTLEAKMKEAIPTGE